VNYFFDTALFIASILLLGVPVAALIVASLLEEPLKLRDQPARPQALPSRTRRV
jgi:hypothetical protein